ncbi:MAG: TIR domain-containing protein [Gemmatimonadetes bacterium]|nr:TIR domain-containing protein [Gemmatimonadota bacterium]
MARRNVFLTYHHANQAEVEHFISSFGSYFNELRAIGVSDEDEFIESDNTDYVLRQIREKYITGTSVTIALIGNCSWARKYIDWEVAATLRNNPTDPRGGLLAIQLPSIDGSNNIRLPSRVELNRHFDSKSSTELGYASYYRYPGSGANVANWVEDAIWRRDNLEPATGSTSDLKKQNSPC